MRFRKTIGSTRRACHIDLDQIPPPSCNPAPAISPPLPRAGPVTTFDRYLLSRFWHVFVVFFIAAMGLYVVADGFTNLDDFQMRAGDGGSSGLLALMAQHYLYHSSLIFELAGPTLGVMAAMCALALSLKHGEIHPLLAAGVPLYRLSLAFVLGILCVNGLLTANQEWVLPRVAPHLQLSRGESPSDAQRIEPMYDHRYWIIISGRQMLLGRRTIQHAEFYLPTPLVADPVTLRADEATYLPEKKDRPAGWLLKGVEPAFDKLTLGDQGREVVFAQENPEHVFVLSEVSFDQLYNRNTSFRYLSTQQLIARIRRPSAGASVRRAQLMSLHERVTRPILTLIGVFLVMPLIARREKMSLVSNVAVCMATLGLVYGAAQGMLLFGHTGWLRPELCAWLPLGIGGSLCAWLTPLART